MLKEKGWRVENVDCTVCLEKPKVSAHVDQMKKVLAPILGVDLDAISIKATTSERLGYVGREEGVNAMVAALITQS
jgi:2-C-methyl-D-erythritol 2,4-cyclodiphosphate synthase